METWDDTHQALFNYTLFKRSFNSCDGLSFKRNGGQVDSRDKGIEHVHCKQMLPKLVQGQVHDDIAEMVK